jgi:small subunit ribosomal protein S13
MFKFRITNIILNKDLTIILKTIYGVSWYKAIKILSYLGISYLCYLNDLNNFKKDLLFFYLENFIISEASIKRYINLRIKRLEDLFTYKGFRHKLFLPVHGQRTRTNANTRRSIRLLKEKIQQFNKKFEKNIQSIKKNPEKNKNINAKNKKI